MNIERNDLGDLPTTPGRIVLLGQVGSTVHGLGLEGKDDRDVMGVCFASDRALFGLQSFEQVEFRTAAVREGRRDAPSKPGDLDLVIYSLQKYVRLASYGNPTVLLLLFLPESNLFIYRELGAELRKWAPRFVTKRAGKAYLGYMQDQMARLMGTKGQKRVHRPELVQKHGYDTKYAMHVCRLGMQGIELMTTGKLSLPMVERERETCMEIRRGEWEKQRVVKLANHLASTLEDAIATSKWPDDMNRYELDLFLTKAYREELRL